MVHGDGATVGADGALSLQDGPDAAGLIGPAVGARHVLALRGEGGAGGVLGSHRRNGLPGDAQQLLNRLLGLLVAPLAVVKVEQTALLVEQVARRPAEVPVLLPDLQ